MGKWPADTSLDRPLLALVTYRRGRLRRLRPLLWVYSLVVAVNVLVVALDPTWRNLARPALLALFSVLFIATWAYSLRRMGRLERELRSRLPQPMEPRPRPSPYDRPPVDPRPAE